jgi:hypothetical protein
MLRKLQGNCGFLAPGRLNKSLLTFNNRPSGRETGVLFVLVLSLATYQGGLKKMSMSFQAEPVSAFQGQAGAALFPSLLQEPPPSPREEMLPAGKVDGRLELPLDELSFHRLTTPAEIGQILHLRGEIQLPATALADPSFHTREKKETSMGL